MLEMPIWTFLTCKMTVLDFGQSFYWSGMTFQPLLVMLIVYSSLYWCQEELYFVTCREAPSRTRITWACEHYRDTPFIDPTSCFERARLLAYFGSRQNCFCDLFPELLQTNVVAIYKQEMTCPEWRNGVHFNICSESVPIIICSY